MATLGDKALGDRVYVKYYDGSWAMGTVIKKTVVKKHLGLS